MLTPSVILKKTKSMLDMRNDNQETARTIALKGIGNNEAKLNIVALIDDITQATTFDKLNEDLKHIIIDNLKRRLLMR